MHGLPSSQFCGVPAWQLPPEQKSPTVHLLPKLHEAVLLVYTQPLAGLQLSEVQPLPSLQVTAAPDWQLPPEQTSPLVQALLSSQFVVRFVWRQPATVSQISEVHGLLSLQLSAVPPGWQALDAQMSPMVHASPSEHVLVFAV